MAVTEAAASDDVGQPRRWRRSGPALERVRAQLSQPMPSDRVWGWVGPLLVTALAALIRFWRLGTPHAFVFDETYYAKDAFSLLRFGSEQSTVTDANDRILHGNLDVFTGSPSFIVHPPIGKWVIALGEKMFGVTPFGWRFMVALLGTVSVLVLARTVRRMTRSTTIGMLAAFLLAIDGLHIVMSRTALLDLTLSFFVLLAFAVLVIDRDRARRRLADRLARFDGADIGPGLGFRPLRVVAGVLLGLALGTKWNALWYLVAFGLLTVAWDVSARRVAGVRHPWLGMLSRDALPAFLSTVPVAAVTYVATWTGWLRGDSGYDRSWATDNPAASGWGWVPGALRSLWHYHAEMWNFHVHLTSPHAYQSHPAGWLILARPVSFFYEGPTRGQDGCQVKQCAREILAIGTPAIWWMGVAALVVMAWLAVARHDWRAAAALTGVMAGWLPWFLFTQRTIFQFYAVVLTPFLAMSVALLLGVVLGPATASARRRMWGAAGVGSYLMVAFANFLLLWPIFTAQLLDYNVWWERLLRIRAWV